MTTGLLADATGQALDAIFTQLRDDLAEVTVRQRRIRDDASQSGDRYNPVSDAYSQPTVDSYTVPALVITESNAINAQNKTEENLNFIIRHADLNNNAPPRPKDILQIGSVRYTVTRVEALPLPNRPVGYDILARRVL